MSTLMLILFLVVVLVPGLLWLGLASAGTGAGADRQSDDRGPRRRPFPESGELPEILRRPLRARL